MIAPLPPVSSEAGRARARFTFLGPEGTFTEAALRQIPEVAESDVTPSSSVISALAAVRAGDADYAMVPIENSVEGGVSATLDDVASGDDLQILAEVLVPISFVLVGREGIGLDEVRRITTHTHAWAQVRGWADAHLPSAEFTPASSTAAGARLLLPQAHDDGTAAPAFDAAVCAPLVAEQAGLPVLAERIEDTAGAVTRFVLVGRPGPLPEPTGSDKTTLTVPLPDDHPGALLEILEQFSTRGINLSRIESRPTGSGLGQYFFSIDLEGHLAEERVQAALAALHRIFPGVRFLGSYPRAVERVVQVPTHMSDAAYRSGREWVAGLLQR
ncbi:MULTISPECIES: prephenate dehydratase [Micrococcus]|uniref:prephenate dehydratase n=1 Tax=Micrococcus TaxID=1269 RepID=UPI000AEF2ACA|nr:MULTISPECIES: prephenate dehydratase [Micrococcus]WIK81881.1 prephenate dehydratase [Micrococcus lylae]